MAGTRHDAGSAVICTVWAYRILLIQRILRHANVSTTSGYYIKTAADDVRSAMKELENRIDNPLQAKRTPMGSTEPVALAGP